MKRFGIMGVAAVLGAALATTALAQQGVKQAEYRAKRGDDKTKVAAAVGKLRGGVKLASWDAHDSYGGDSYGGDIYGGAPCGDECYGGDCGCEIGCSDSCSSGYTSGLLGGGMCNSGRQFFVGGEYLSVRSNASEAVSFLARDISNLTSPTDTFNQFDFDFDSSFRVYAGCRNACCGEEIRFTYTRFDTDSAFTSPSVPQGSNGTIQFIAPLEVIATIDGQRVEGDASVELDNYDLGWSKTIPLGSPLMNDCDCGDVCGDECGDPCGGGWCPAWDLTFTGALRAAKMDAQRNYASFLVDNTAVTTGSTRFEFDGVGARLGLLGRRYFGKRGIASVYLKGDFSLLVGEYDSVQQRASAATPNQITSQSIGCTHVIPVTEIEAGGTIFITCNTSLSGGYFMSAWHDLGFRDEYDFGLQTSYDDANIMGFDGFFVRLEKSF